MTRFRLGFGGRGREVVNMPEFDGTGPQGAGSGTGRGMGNCGQGMKKGFGGRCYNRGMRMGLQFDSKEDKMKMLNNQEKMLREELKAIEEEKKSLEK